MQLRKWFVGMVILPVLMAGPVGAQHVADQATIHLAVIEAAAAEEADRVAILQVLERRDVRDMATRLGVDIKTAESAIRTLSGPDLAAMADSARAIAADQTGGASTTVTISITTLLLILIIIILLVD